MDLLSNYNYAILKFMLKSILKSTTWKQSQITIVATFINGALGALFYILVARLLGPSDFGLLIVCITTLTLIGDMVDFGTNTGLVRFVSEHISNNHAKALQFLKLSLEIKLIIWILVFIVGFLISPFLAQVIFGKRELTFPLELVMFGVGSALLFTYATSALQAFQKYISWGFINIITNLIRLVIIYLLFLSEKLNLITSLTAYIALPFFGFFLTMFFLPTKDILQTRKELTVSKQFFRFNLWIAAFTLIAAISSRMDTFLNARLLSSFEIGIYAAANQLVQIVPQLISALGVVAAPKFAGFRNYQEMLVYLKKFQLLVLGIAGLGILAIPVSIYLIPLLFGMRYQLAIVPFVILLIAMLVFLISVPIHNSIIYYFGKSEVFVWVAIGNFIIMGGLGYLLISRFGVMGAAITVLLGNSFNFLAPLGWFVYKIKK